MSVWAVLATGPSMSQAVADQVRGRCRVVAVSDAYRLAPWADALASTDAAWWAAHPEARQTPAQKFTGAPYFQPIEGVDRLPHASSGTNSGLFGCMVARHLGAHTLLLCGFDMRGSHFFGAHPEGLSNTTPNQFEIFQRQFSQWWPKGLAIVNCTPGSALKAYPALALDAALERYAPC